jgi:hypothetical protein
MLNSLWSHMLHHSQLAFYEQARCLFHKKIYLLWNRHLACCWQWCNISVWINLTMRQHISAYLLSSYFKVAVLPVKYSLPATFETFGLYPLRGIPKMVQRAEPRRGKLSTHPVPPRRASGSFRPCAHAARNTDNADSLNLHLRCSRDFSNRFCNEIYNNTCTPTGIVYYDIMYNLNSIASGECGTIF